MTNRVQFGFPGFTGAVDTSVAGLAAPAEPGKERSLNNSPRNMLMMLKYRF